MAGPVKVRSHADIKSLADCPECGASLEPIESPAARALTMAAYGGPTPYAGKKCPKCGWQVG